MAVEAARGRFLIEESPEMVLVLDENDVVVVASRRARDLLEGVREGERDSRRTSSRRTRRASRS